MRNCLAVLHRCGQQHHVHQRLLDNLSGGEGHGLGVLGGGAGHGGHHGGLDRQRLELASVDRRGIPRCCRPRGSTGRQQSERQHWSWGGELQGDGPLQRVQRGPQAAEHVEDAPTPRRATTARRLAATERRSQRNRRWRRWWAPGSTRRRSCARPILSCKSSLRRIGNSSVCSATRSTRMMGPIYAEE